MPQKNRASIVGVLCQATVLVVGIACAIAELPPATQPVPLPPADLPDNPLVTSLFAVAGAALEAGDLNNAEQRFQRVLEIRPHSGSAKLGLARVARLRGDEAAERRWLDEVLGRDPRSLGALLHLAQLEVLMNRPERARELVDQALAIDPNHSELLAMLLDLSGLAQSLEGLSVERILELARLHPFDLRVQLRAARIRIEAGEIEHARKLLRSSYWLADLDPIAGREIAQTLSEIDSEFAARVIVRVHVYADQSITRQPGWEMRLRVLWRKTSAAFSPLLATYFVPVSMSAFSTARAGNSLVSLESAWERSSARWPEHGLLVAFTERRGSRHEAHLLGRAELLGRRAIVRLDSYATESRTLIHEVFHLYGGVHVADVLDSLMNPTGDTATIDVLNAEIIRLTRNRSFGPGGDAVNIDPYVDTSRLVDVYINALGFNLMFRREGLGRATELGRASRYAAADLARAAVRLDDHLAQVSEHISQMLARDRFYAKAAGYSDLAAKLHGERSSKGRQQMRRADRLRQMSVAVYSEPSPTPGPSPLPTETK